MALIGTVIGGIATATDTVEKIYAYVNKISVGVSSKEFCRDTSQTDGVRVIERSTTLDLSAWKAASADDLIRHTPIEAALSRNKFVIERTDRNQSCFLHRMGTSSGILPKVHCDRCVAKLLPRAEGSPLTEWNLEFDVQDKPIATEIEITFDVTFYNSFQRPDQWWSGFRILHSTEKAIYKVIFPTQKMPTQESIAFGFVKPELQKWESINVSKADRELELTENLVQSIKWTVANPQPDRSYRVKWSW